MANDLLFRLLEINLAAAVAILVVLALRRPARRLMGAQAAYALWLVVPTAMLAVLAPPRTIQIMAQVPPPAPSVSDLMPALQPMFAVSSIPAAPTTVSGPTFNLGLILVGLWLLGVMVSLALLAVGQRRALAQFGKITAEAGDNRVARASNPGVGPALLGALRPRVILPTDFETRFDATEQRMVLAHEHTHLANGHALINGATALVRAANWFNPLIHWGARAARVDQELACDAVVVARFPGERKTYAEALLKTQLAFTSLPLGCDWPVRSTSRLEERIEMLAQVIPGRTRLLTGGGVIAILVAGAGLTAWASEPPVLKSAAPQPPSSAAVAKALVTRPDNTANLAPAATTPEAPKPIVLAQAEASPRSAPGAAAIEGPSDQMRAEQERPRQVVPFDPARFDRYVGYYEFPSHMSFQITRVGDKFFSQLPGQPAVEVYPESDSKFFATVVAAQISFVTDAEGKPTALVLHQNGYEQTAFRIDPAKASAQALALEKRIADNSPSPGTAAFLKRYLDSLEAGAPDYSQMGPLLANAARTQNDGFQTTLKTWGPLQSIQFSAVTPQGFDRYTVTFKNTEMPVIVAPFGADGKVSGLQFMVQNGKVAVSPDIAARIKANTPSPGTEASVRKWLASLVAGQPDYDDMTPGLAEAARQQWPQTSQRVQAFGALKDVRFLRVNPQGFDVYEADFQNNKIQVAVAPLTADGKVSGRSWQVLP